MFWGLRHAPEQMQWLGYSMICDAVTGLKQTVCAAVFAASLLRLDIVEPDFQATDMMPSQESAYHSPGEVVTLVVMAMYSGMTPLQILKLKIYTDHRLDNNNLFYLYIVYIIIFY